MTFTRYSEMLQNVVKEKKFSKLILDTSKGKYESLSVFPNNQEEIKIEMINRYQIELANLRKEGAYIPSEIGRDPDYFKNNVQEKFPDLFLKWLYSVSVGIESPILFEIGRQANKYNRESYWIKFNQREIDDPVIKSDIKENRRRLGFVILSLALLGFGLAVGLTVGIAGSGPIGLVAVLAFICGGFGLFTSLMLAVSVGKCRLTHDTSQPKSAIKKSLGERAVALDALTADINKFNSGQYNQKVPEDVCHNSPLTSPRATISTNQSDAQKQTEPNAPDANSQSACFNLA